jgi:ubiquinone/menaquinone biosynthesis C-methylase UbiE
MIKLIKKSIRIILATIKGNKTTHFPLFIAGNSKNEQDLNPYYSEEFAKILEIWGETHVWNEIQLLLANCSGKVLDIACGTGIVMKRLEKFENIEVHGFDISDLLIEKAQKKGLKHLSVQDATKPDYDDLEFDFSYSIGSLEHFTEEGIVAFLKEASRYTKKASFHMIPVSRTGKNEGWIKTIQTYFNNSEEWWLDKFKASFRKVEIVNSSWDDSISFGRWFICYK